MNVRSYLMYAAKTKLTPDHYYVAPELFVRAEPMECDYNEAMGRCDPLEGENFMNSIPATF